MSRLISLLVKIVVVLVLIWLIVYIFQWIHVVDKITNFCTDYPNAIRCTS